MGCLTPAGRGAEAVARLLEGGLPLCDAPASMSHLPRAGWIDPLERPAPWKGRAVRFPRLDRLSRVTLVAAQLALTDEDPPADGSRAGVALGTAFGSHLTNEQFYRSVTRQEASPALFTYTLPSSAVGELSICLGLRGPALTLTHGPGSGLAAVAAAAAMVDRGAADWMIAGGCDVLGPTLLASSGGQRLGEGGVLVSLGRERHGALARVAGWAQATGDGAEERAATAALKQAGLTRDRVVTRATAGPLAGLGAAGPVARACALLARQEPLPALVTAIHEQGADVLCLAAS